MSVTATCPVSAAGTANTKVLITLRRDVEPWFKVLITLRRDVEPWFKVLITLRRDVEPRYVLVETTGECQPGLVITTERDEYLAVARHHDGA